LRVLIISDTIEFSGAEESVVTLAKLLYQAKDVELRFCSTRFIDNCIERSSFEDSYIINKKKPLSVEELYSTLLNPIIFIKVLRHCIEVADDFRPDVVHSGIFLSLLPSIIVARRLKVPVIEHIHDYRALSLTDLPFLQGNISRISYTQELKYYLQKVKFYKSVFAVGFRRFWRSLYDQCNLLIAVSNFVKESLSPYLKPPIEVVYNVVDTNGEGGYAKRKRDKICIAYSGRLSSSKGFPIFLRATKLLLRSGVDVEIHITGRGELKPLAHRFAKTYQKNVKFHGYLPSNELYDLIASCHVTVHPSLWPEPCPLSVFKSVKLGTTALASNRGGLSELLLPRYLFKPNAKELHNKLFEFIRNPDEFPPSLAIEANPATITNELLDIYRFVTCGSV
jgi:glycosyltransferase involved in cell wall biosynthesis